MRRLRPVEVYGLVGGAAMLLMALETLLGFGPEVRATLQAVVGTALLGGFLNARQWNVSSEGGVAPMAEPPPRSPCEE